MEQKFGINSIDIKALREFCEHEDWKCLLITYDEEGTEEGIPVVPVWKWLMRDGL